MLKSKKVFIFVLLIGLIGSLLIGCNKNEPAAPATPGEPAQPKKLELTFYDFQTGGGVEEASMRHFKDLVEERSNGNITVDVIVGPVMGGEKEMTEMLSMGEIEMASPKETITAWYAPKLDPTVIPFLFPDDETFMAAWEGEIGQRIKDSIAENQDIILIGQVNRGARQLTSNRKVIKPEDLRGMKLRLPEIPGWIITWSELGTLPTPIASPEIFSALQTGVVEAQENPLTSIHQRNLWEVQDYLIMTNHKSSLYHWGVNKTWWEGLDAEHRDLLAAAAEESIAFANKYREDGDAALLQDMIDNGMEVVEPDRAAIRAAVQPAIDQLIEELSPETQQLVIDFLGL